MKRPPPKFDMDLRELFPDDMAASARPSHSFPQPLQGLHQQQHQQQQQQYQHQHQQRQHAFQTSPRSGQMSPASSIASQITGGGGSGMGGGMNTSQNGGNNSPFMFNKNQPQSAQEPFYMQNTYNPDFMSSLPGMDFLNNVGAGSGEDSFNFDAGGLDLGFGMGLDLQHDWSDGQQYDLFDGFFFGGNANGSGNGNGNGDGSGSTRT